MRSNRFEQKQEARTAGSTQHKPPTFASLLLLVAYKCNTASKPGGIGWELFQPIERTRCGTFEPKLAAEREVSFERDGLDASKACHISARGNARSRATGSGSTGPEAGRLEKRCHPVLL